MIRLINPVLHTKYLDAHRIRSMCLWWTERPTIEKTKAFLQFECEKGAEAYFDTIWKYPCFHLARTDMDQVLKQAPWITHRMYQYQLEPVILLGSNSAQRMGDTPPSTSAAFAALNGLLPKNPL